MIWIAISCLALGPVGIVLGAVIVAVGIGNDRISARHKDDLVCAGPGVRPDVVPGRTTVDRRTWAAVD